MVIFDTRKASCDHTNCVSGALYDYCDREQSSQADDPPQKVSLQSVLVASDLSCVLDNSLHPPAANIRCCKYFMSNMPLQRTHECCL